MKTPDLVIIFLILFLTTFYVKEKFVNEVQKVKSDSDGRSYVVRVEEDSKQAANLLGTINLKLISFKSKEKIKLLLKIYTLNCDVHLKLKL